MNVALFTETYTPHVNGVVTHVKTLKNGLEKLGHKVMVVTADKHARHHYIEDGILHCPAAEIKRFYGFGVATPTSRKRMRLIAAFNPDVLHIHNEFGIGISGILAARSLKRPLVYTLHTMYDQYIFYIAPQRFLEAATKFSHRYSKFIARNATEITGPSRKCEEYINEIGLDKQVNLIPNSVDLEEFDPAKVTLEQKETVRQKYSIPSDRMICCFAGRLGKEKSIDVLMQFWAEHITLQDNMHLLIIGHGPDRELLNNLAKELNIADMVTFTGMVDHREMPVYFGMGDVFISASLSEMNSISMLEGMATGLIVLQRYDKMNDEQIQSGVNGFTFTTSSEMADKLREIAAYSPEELAVSKAKVIGSVEERGSQSLAKYMLTVYEKAIEEKKATIASPKYK